MSMRKNDGAGEIERHEILVCNNCDRHDAGWRCEKGMCADGNPEPSFRLLEVVPAARLEAVEAECKKRMLDLADDSQRHSERLIADRADARDERDSLADALREIAEDTFYYCNKCGHFGSTGPRHDGCNYEASESASSRIACKALADIGGPEHE